MQFLVYILVYPLLWIISILPFRLMYFLSDGFYALLYYIIGYRKKVVTNNLKLAFPKKTNQEISLIRKRFYHHLCDMMFEAIKSITISEAEMQKRYVFTNVEEIHKLEKENSDNPQGPQQSFDPQEPNMPKRSMRGGSFLCNDSYCSGYRVARRMKSSEDSGFNHTGFRCVKDIQ